METRIALLIRGLQQAFGAPAWHGPNLTDAIAGLSDANAAWRPAPEANSAWELIVHAAYWKYRVLQHIEAEPPEAFSEPGSNFFARPANQPLAHDIATLRDWHGRLVTAAEEFDPARLNEVAYDDYSFEDVLMGAAAHDVYHAGQIRLLRRLREAVQPLAPEAG